jgi:CHAT domain-containing protein/tetratricopeptide (TPR) repeat protein
MPIANAKEWLGNAEAALRAGDAAAFESAVTKARAVLERTKDPTSTADARLKLGHLLYRSAAHAAAIDVLRIALEEQLSVHGERSWQAARSRRLLGLASIGLQRWDDALAEFEAAVLIDPDSDVAKLEVGLSAGMLGSLHVTSGRGEKALRVLRRALELLPAGVPEIQNLRERSEDDLGYAFLLLDRLDAAEYYLERATSRQSTNADDQTVERADRYWQLAQLYGRQHRLAYGVECARRAVAMRRALLQPTDIRLGQAQLVLAALLNECEEWAEARSNYYAALQIMQAAGVPDVIEYLVATTGVLRAAVKMGETENPEHDLENFLKISDQLGRDHGDGAAVQVLVDLAVLKERRGDTRASRALAGRAHAAGSQATGYEMNRLAYHDLARLHVTHGDAAEAVAVLRWIADIDDGLAQRLVDTYHLPQRVLYSDDLAEVTGELVRIILEHLPQSEEAARIAFEVVLARKALLTEADIAHNHRTSFLKGRGVDEQLNRTDTLRAKIRARLAEGPTDGNRKLAGEVETLRRELREAESLLASATDDLPAIHAVPDVDIDELARRMAPDEVLIEYLALRGPRHERRVEMLEPDLLSEIHPQRYVAFVLKGGTGRVQIFDLGEADPIERLVYSHIAAAHPTGVEEISRDRRAALEPGDEAAIGARLREKVFDPIAPHVTAAARLRIAPDGAIGAVAFAMLPLENGVRLIDKHEVSYVSCGRVLLRDAGNYVAAAEPVTLCDPDFDVEDLSAVLAQGTSRADFYFDRLPCTAEEGARVQARVAGKLIERGNATLACLLDIRSPSILHLATHGFFLPVYGEGINVIGDWRAFGGLWFRGHVLSFSEEPLLRTGLALAGVNAYSAGRETTKEVGDGLLTALDVTRLDLRATEMVFLSACSAARGSVRPGEGSAGLLQAFEAAGARRVVASLWAIADHPATVTLIDRFYAQLMAGQDVAAALCRAQRDIKRLGAPAWVWGALVAYGDPAPVR